MQLTALMIARVPEDIPERLAHPLPPSITHSTGRRAQPATHQVLEESVHTAAFSVEPSRVPGAPCSRRA